MAPRPFLVARCLFSIAHLGPHSGSVPKAVFMFKWNRPVALVGSWPTEEVPRIDALHRLTWDEVNGVPRAGAALQELANTDHPLARCLTLFYAWRGMLLERLGVSYRGRPSKLADTARAALRESPISLVEGKRSVGFRARAPGSEP